MGDVVAAGADDVKGYSAGAAIGSLVPRPTVEVVPIDEQPTPPGRGGRAAKFPCRLEVSHPRTGAGQPNGGVHLAG